MKTLALAVVPFFVSSFAFASDAYFRPTEQCLTNISDALFKLGTAPTPEENVIDFEATLSVEGSVFTILYYKRSAGSVSLDITGVAQVDLDIQTRDEVDPDFFDIPQCTVRSAKIISEIVD